MDWQKTQGKALAGPAHLEAGEASTPLHNPGGYERVAPGKLGGQDQMGNCQIQCSAK